MPSSRLVAVIAFLGMVVDANARPPHKKALADHFGPLLAAKLNDCRTCHVPGPADVTSTEAKPHNPFGARLRAVKKELQQAGKRTDIVDRLNAIADEDSDGDGVSNVIEMISGHNPGEADDKPTPEEIEQAQVKLTLLKERLNAYAWRPFEPVVRPEVPHVQNTGWVRNPIDAYIAAEHDKHGLKPRPEAPKAVLLRRAYIDLIGLPPTPAELHAFLADESPDAYEKVIENLLSRPQYGERWGRHWMDVWRYSDWAGWGNEVRDSQPHVWRWRDWIVESLNSDKPYDRMIAEMLAGDEIAPEDPKVLAATGYLVRNYKRYSRERWLQDAVDHTFMAFQGVTINCARCHDHVYDPILQREYYQVRAIFAPHNQRIDRLPGHLDTAQDGLARAFDAEPNAQTFVLIRGDDRNPDKTPLEPGVPDLLGIRSFKPEPVSLPKDASAPDKRNTVIKDLLNDVHAKAQAAREALNNARKQHAATVLALGLADPAAATGSVFAGEQSGHALKLAELQDSTAATKAFGMEAMLQAEKLEDEGKKDSADWKIAATAATEAQRKAALLEAEKNAVAARWAHRMAKKPQLAQTQMNVAEADKLVAKAEMAYREPPSINFTRRNVVTYPAQSTGRRLAFAKWLGDAKNPLTARVAMNHVWLRHFGDAIVPSVFDFGRNGRPPSHPALLDWLAAEFMERGWSMKQMHRLMLTSSTYRQASTPDADGMAKDPDNRLLWRMTPKRIEAEVVRDGILYVTGQLDLKLGGPDIDQNQGLAVPRRSLYFRHAAEKQMEFLKLFDAAAVSECYQRKASIMPQQALALANSDLTVKSARQLAQKLKTDCGGDASRFVEAAFEAVLARPASHEELLESVAFLKEQARRLAESQPGVADADLRARESLVKVMMNHHDFVTLK